MYGLFAEEPRYPAGFEYHPGFLSAAEERALLEWAAGVVTRPSRYGDYTALRRTASFRLRDDARPLAYYDQRAESLEDAQSAAPKPPPPLAPDLLRELAARVARFTGRDASAFPHALLTEYPPGAPMGWHRDAPPWRVIYGVSLGAPCRFFLRPHFERLRLPSATIRLSVEPRSLYVMAGQSRSDWQHSIAPLKALRYSITLRTM